MFVEPYKDIQQSLILPDSTKGELFKILAIGPGMINRDGKRLEVEVKVGDIAAIEGVIKTIPFQGDRYNVARAGDTVAYYRPIEEKVDIPDRI